MESKEVNEIREKLKQLGNPTLAQNYKRYLKSPYEFYGLRVPQLRKIAKSYKNISIYDAYNLFDELFYSNNHEEMCMAIFLLQNYKKQYHIDALCGGILGYIVAENNQLNAQLKDFSTSRNPWIRRVSIVSQGSNIKKGKIQLTILLAERLCHDEDIYVQKATGWMLREAGKKNPIQIQEFIKIHRAMKPACLSYATEKMLPFRTLIKSMKENDKSNNDANKENEISELEKIKHFKN